MSKLYRVVREEEAIEKVRKCYRISKEKATERVKYGNLFHFSPGISVIPYSLKRRLGKSFRRVDEKTIRFSGEKDTLTYSKERVEELLNVYIFSEAEQYEFEF